MTTTDKSRKFGTLCFDQGLGQFTVWYHTRDERLARILHKCITNHEKSFFGIED